MNRPYDLGFLGGGQLARMSIQAAQRMGLRCISLDPGEVTPSSQIAEALPMRLDDPASIAAIAGVSRHLTLENEFIPADALAEGLRRADFDESLLTPSIATLRTIQDKLSQRNALASAGVASPQAVELGSDPGSVIGQIGFPMVLKARFGGYDGKGTRYAKSEQELEGHRALWGPGGWLAEQFVPFKRELAVMVYVGADGSSGCFPTVETVQRDHVCDLVFPCDADGSKIGMAAVKAVGGRGLFGVELFELRDGSLQVNEIAPRPHNTGHYTLDWGGISQFEQHVRLALRLPTIEPQGHPTCMANLLGQRGAGDFRKGLHAALEAEPEARIHWYGKEESRQGRKMGHLNVVGEDCVERAKLAREAFYKGWVE